MTGQESYEVVLVLNSSVVITLSELGRPDLLSRLRKGVRVIIPPEVRHELERGKSRYVTSYILQFEANIDRSCINPEVLSLLEGLGEGERGAITTALVLASSGNKVAVITDDKRARRVCRNLRLRVIGTLGLIEFLKLRGFISKEEAIELIESLPMTSLYITNRLIIEEVKERIREQA